MELFDSHSHLYVEEFDPDRAAVVQRAREAGVSKIILPAIDLPTLDRLLEMCDDYAGLCYPLIGLHPTEVNAGYEDVLSVMWEKLQACDAFVGIGEVGLDFYWDQTYKKEQLAAFEIQIGWALEKHLPLVIHARSAHRELVDTLYKYKGEDLRGIFHCFAGTAEECDELLQFEGFCLGIGGVLTYRKSTLPEVVGRIPRSRIVVETDSPYLSPVPHRGKRNESAYLRDTVGCLAGCLNTTPEEVAKITFENAEKLFFRPKIKQK